MKEQIFQNSNQYDAVFIRHAQSDFNQSAIQIATKLGIINKSWSQIIKNQEFNKAVTFNLAYIDPHITSQGIQQCLRAQKLFDPSQIDLIFVSPHLRALQTCQHIFGRNNPNVVVHPLVTEVVRYVCDISNSMEQKIQLFPHYDYEEMKNWTDEWYFQVLSQNKRQLCQQYFQKHKIHDYQGHQKIVLELLSKQIITQSAKELRQRVIELKKVIKQYKQNKKAKKIAVISHHYTTQCLLSPKFDQNGNVLGIGQIMNAIPYFRKLQNVLTVE